MLSVSGKNWEEIKVGNRVLEKLKNEKNFSELVSKIIISNNFDDLEINSLKQNTWKNKKKLQLILLDIIDLFNKA